MCRFSYPKRQNARTFFPRTDRKEAHLPKWTGCLWGHHTTASSAGPRAAVRTGCSLPASNLQNWTFLGVCYPERSQSGGLGVWGWEPKYEEVLKFWILFMLTKPFRRVTSATVPGAPDVSWTGRLDLWTHLSQHVTEVLGRELRRTHDGLTSDLWGEEQRSSGSACPSTEQRKGTERSTHLSQCELRLLQLVRRIHTHLLGGEARKRWRWWWDWK